MRITVLPLLTLAALLLPARASAVSAIEARAGAGGVIFRSSAGELHFVRNGETRSAIIGRLPKGTTLLSGDGVDLWALARYRPVTLFRVHEGTLTRITPEIDATLAPATGPLVGFTEIAGCDGSHVYLRGRDGSGAVRRARYDIGTNRIEPGHLDAHPVLTVVATRQAREGTVLLAEDDASPPNAWLVREPDACVPLHRPRTSFTRFAGGDRGLVLSMLDTLLVIDPCTLEVRDDLSDVVPRGPRLFASLDASAAWVDVRTPRGSTTHWRIDLATREVIEVAAPMGRKGHDLVADDGERLWFARLIGSMAPSAPVAVMKTEGTIERVNLHGPPGSGLRVVGRGLEAGAALVLYLPACAVSAVAGGVAR